MKNTLYTLVLSAALFSCAENNNGEINDPLSPTNMTESDMLNFSVDTLYTDLENPWGMVWLEDGRMLVTERQGEILIFENDEFTGEKVQGMPDVYARGQGGLLDIQRKDDWLYIAYAKPMQGGGATTIMRARLEGNNLVDQEELIQTTPATDSGVHFGCRIIFDNEDYLYFSSGERGTKPNAQDLTNSHGKIHRINLDGSIPEDNPFVNEPNAVKSIWTYGNRNPQGMIYDAENNRIWAHEHGPKGGDELNLIEKGKNYGWPLVTFGVDYDGSVISEETEKEGITPPVHYWDPSIAPCGMVQVTSDRYGAWQGNLLIGALAHQHVARVELDGTTYAGEEKLLQDIGRVRHVAQSPDGYIYVITEGTGLMVKLIPEE
ncbi:PQQ-dependent sugar dehydrogenase [Litoribacter alkaliphilus]|uniref:PQQ-dependent sugar dehydrogenase n=1 Tax=Litoribacter ruber TaxID=702568 RepID=A0AAP2CFL4_9BACT|nr:PQQ-dependent sugar dehydrogenase [Litoribacter alkaliphilus]MBS9523693.1 PQQ-dependent sugar dehydrogenase [Litoribacter alkaliphilus]